MLSSAVPGNIAVPFADGAGAGFIATIPVPSQISTTPGKASFTDGFPPLCFQPPASGGVPPFGADFNGVLHWLSSWVRWQQAGGVPGYDAAFSTAIGGYPLGAVLKNAAGTGFWSSTVENNVTDPDTGGAGWTILTPASYPWSSITGVPALVTSVNGASGAVTVTSPTKAWVNFDGTASSPTAAAGLNISSITKISTGVYTITFTAAMANTHYAVSGSVSCDQSQNCVITVLAATAGAAATLKTTTAVTVCIAISGGGFFDSVETSVVINSL